MYFHRVNTEESTKYLRNKKAIFLKILDPTCITQNIMADTFYWLKWKGKGDSEIKHYHLSPVDSYLTIETLDEVLVQGFDKQTLVR